MIKARSSQFALIGLSRINIEHLMAGRPIMTSGAEIGLPGALAIMFGETEDDIVAELREAGKLNGVETEVIENGREEGS